MRWWQWLDFDDELAGQVWAIVLAQCVLLVVAGCVLHGMRAS